MGNANFIEPSQLLDKDPENLSHMMVAMPLLVLTSECSMLRGILIFEQFVDIMLF